MFQCSLPESINKIHQIHEPHQIPVTHPLFVEILTSNSPKWVPLISSFGSHLSVSVDGDIELSNGSDLVADGVDSVGDNGGKSGDQRGKKKKKRSKKKRQNFGAEDEGLENQVWVTPDKHDLVCLYPFTSSSSATQRKIKQQYDQLKKSHDSKALTLAQSVIGNLVVDLVNDIQSGGEDRWPTYAVFLEHSCKESENLASRKARLGREFDLVSPFSVKHLEPRFLVLAFISLLALVSQFVNCLIEARNELQHKSEVIHRKFTITKALLVKADRSSFDRICQQIYKLEAEQKRLEEDAAVYNLLQQQLKLSPAYKKMLEIGARMELKAKSGQPVESTDTEFANISFEELLAQEKKDSFWQRNGKLRSCTS
ncbi:hypothetical protein HHK36_021776 [Tetracentron sinense]|uniref:Uncharacterized protein n=1 Tax=Tetracentron sinense TaxID=13715 RepID=A0A834YXL4_TETSI|nr:hypothetical protein HHK36_021776 [Tetracentron sinense]